MLTRYKNQKKMFPDRKSGPPSSTSNTH